EDTRECLRYLKELGVDNFQSSGDASLTSARMAPAEAVGGSSTPPLSPPVFIAQEPQATRHTASPQVGQDFLFGDVAPDADGGLAPSSETLEDIWADIG